MTQPTTRPEDADYLALWETIEQEALIIARGAGRGEEVDRDLGALAVRARALALAGLAHHEIRCTPPDRARAEHYARLVGMRDRGLAERVERGPRAVLKAIQAETKSDNR